MKRIFFITSLFLAAFIAFAAGKNDQAQAGRKTKIVFWHSMGLTNGEALKGFIDEYNASQDKIVVEGQYQGNYVESANKMQATPKGMGPDIIQVASDLAFWAAESGFFKIIQDLSDSEKFDLSDFQRCALEQYSINGRVYSMPHSLSTPVLIYNKNALAKAGLDPKTAFATLDDCIATARKLKAVGIDVGGTFPIDSWNIGTFMAIQNADILDNNNGRGDRPTRMVNRDRLLNLLKKYHAAARDPAIKPMGIEGAESAKQFSGGLLGYFQHSSAYYASLNASIGGAFEVGFAPVPRVSPDDTGGVTIGGASLWLSDNGDAEKINAAWDFIKYLTSSDIQARWAAKTGYLPARQSSVDLPVYQQYLKNTNPEAIVAIEQMRQSRKAGILCGAWSQLHEIINKEVENMMVNPLTTTPENTTDTIINRSNEVLALYNRTNQK